MVALLYLALFVFSKVNAECEEPPCHSLYEPVCGSDLVTYNNECELANAALCRVIGVTKLKGCACGEVCAECEELRCNRMYQPVCGSDSVTYNNECELNNAALCRISGLTKMKNCACDDTCEECEEAPCNRMYLPVCGSDAVTYNNECELNNAALCRVSALTKVKDCACEEACEESNCDTPCQKNYAPVCASNGVTYGNECMMERAVCLSGGDLSELTKVKDCACEDDSADCGGSSAAQDASGIRNRNITAAAVASIIGVLAIVAAVLVAMWQKQLYCFRRRHPNDKIEGVTLVATGQLRSDDL